MNYFICGFSGAGKSWTLQTLAQDSRYTDYKFIDLDGFILNLYPNYKTLEDLIKDKGWDWFRKEERDQFKSLVGAKDKLWVALGGGTLDDCLINWIKQQKNLTGFWLNTDFETCWQRISHDSTRPLVQEGKSYMHRLYQKRLNFYKNFEKYNL